jgi:hypothetical protein
VSLRDAAEYITELPRAEHDADQWQAAMQALLLVAEPKTAPSDLPLFQLLNSSR